MVLCLCELSLDYLCSWKVQVSVYCARRITAHLVAPSSILLYVSISASYRSWHISQIQTCLCAVVRPGFVSTSHAFMRSSASFSQNGKLGPHCTAFCNRHDSCTVSFFHGYLLCRSQVLPYLVQHSLTMC